jgi:hypothetical protein
MDTVIITQVLGVFFIVVGISMTFNSKGTRNAIEASIENKGILFLWGMLALLIGAWIVDLNNMWTSGMPLLVTILGWLALIKGVFILIFPNATASLYRKFNKGGMLMLVGVVVLIIGLVLLY